MQTFQQLLGAVQSKSCYRWSIGGQKLKQVCCWKCYCISGFLWTSCMKHLIQFSTKSYNEHAQECQRTVTFMQYCTYLLDCIIWPLLDTSILSVEIENTHDWIWLPYVPQTKVYSSPVMITIGSKWTGFLSGDLSKCTMLELQWKLVSNGLVWFWVLIHFVYAS